MTPATGIVVRDGDERDRLWDPHVAQLPHFADYPATTGRLIPMFGSRCALGACEQTHR